MEPMTISLGVRDPAAGDGLWSQPLMNGRTRVGTLTRRPGTTWVKINENTLEVDQPLTDTKAQEAAQRFADLLTDVTE